MNRRNQIVQKIGPKINKLTFRGESCMFGSEYFPYFQEHNFTFLRSLSDYGNYFSHYNPSGNYISNLIIELLRRNLNVDRRQ